MSVSPEAKLPDHRIVSFRGSLAVTWYDEKGERQRRALGTDDAYKAPSRAVEILKALQPIAASEVKTVGQHVEAYLNAIEEEGAITISKMRGAWKLAKPTFDKLMPEQIERITCKSYKAFRKVGDACIRKELGIVRSALKRGKKLHLADFWFPPAPPPKDFRLTRSEWQDLMDEFGTRTHLVLYLIVARYTAARPGAILDLKWEQIDFARRQINLRGSGRQKVRAVIPMHQSLAWALALAKEAALSDHVIEWGGRRVKSVKVGFRKAVEQAGLPVQITPHVMRHTSASWMAEDGVPIRMIATFLGHTNSLITEKVYAKYTPGYMAQALKALN